MVILTDHIVELIFLFAAAISKAVADTLIHHFESSIFYYPKSRFWNVEVSNQFPRYFPFTGYKFDAWHLSNSGMIGCFVLFACKHQMVFSFWVDVIVSGFIFIVVFNIFYNKLLRK